MNDWRREDESDLTRVVSYEQKLLEWMKGEKHERQTLDQLTTGDVNSLTVKLMNEKFEKKWGDKLNESQRALLRDYIHGKVDESMLESIKKRAIRGLSRLQESTTSQVLLEKLNDVRDAVESSNTRSLDDDGIVKFMQITQLYQELEKKDE
jgi:DNA gyrase/topoisomerase IV subunit B